jgi:predicted P-loop ATPase
MGASNLRATKENIRRAYEKGIEPQKFSEAIYSIMKNTKHQFGRQDVQKGPSSKAKSLKCHSPLVSPESDSLPLRNTRYLSRKTISENAASGLFQHLAR